MDASHEFDETVAARTFHHVRQDEQVVRLRLRIHRLQSCRSWSSATQHSDLPRSRRCTIAVVSARAHRRGYGRDLRGLRVPHS